MSASPVSLLEVIGGVVMWSSLVPIAIGIFRHKEITPGLKCILLLAFVSFSSDLLFQNLHGALLKNIVGRVFTVAEFTLISLFFYFEITRKLTRFIILIMTMLFVVVAIEDFILQGPNKRDNLPMGIEAVVLLLYSLIVLYFIMKDMVYTNILSTPTFWVIAATLIYFGGSIFIFISINYMSPEQGNKFWIVHDILMITNNALISIGLWKARTQYR